MIGGTNGGNVSMMDRTVIAAKSLTSVLLAVLLKRPDVIFAGLEGTAILCDGPVQIGGDDIINSQVLGVPATIVDTTVQPCQRTIRSGIFGGFL